MEIKRSSEVRWHTVSKLVVSPAAQRPLNEGWADKIAAEFNVDKLGIPVVSERDGAVWVVDGQHRVRALKLVGWSDQKIQCDTYVGLTEAEEAELFDGLNDSRSVGTYAKFQVRLTAGRSREVGISRAVSDAGYQIANGKIKCVTALGKVYDAGGDERVVRVVSIIGEAFGVDAIRADVVAGLGLVVGRYGDKVGDEEFVRKFSALRGGYTTLRQKAEFIRQRVGKPKDQCMAAAIVDVVNAGRRGGSSLGSWWA